MKKPSVSLIAFAALALAVPFMTLAEDKQPYSYPTTRWVDQLDTYHGTTVPDPYRWLEDDRSADTAAWVQAENKITDAYLAAIPYRGAIRQRLEELYDYPKLSPPSRKGEWFYFSKNDGLQNQSVIYRQRGLDGTPEVFIDPNKFSPDGTIKLSQFRLSKDGKHAAYSISRGGSDWNEIYVMDASTKELLKDHLLWAKFSGVAWQGDGFYYGRYDAPEKGHELSSKNENHKIYFHRIGTPQADDKLVFEDAAHPLRMNHAETTEDERFIVLSITERSSGKKGNALFYREAKAADGKWLPLIPEIGDDQYGVIDNVGDNFLVHTNRKAPNDRIVLVDPKNPAEENWKEVVPEKPESMQSTGTAGGKLFVTYLKDVATRAYVYSLTGELENEIELPGPGSAGGFGGEKDDTFVFYTYTSFNYPPTTFRYDIASRKSTFFRAPEIPNFKSEDYESKQVFVTSKDGTRVPMFLTYRKGLKLDGNNPTLLYGYGGFNVSLTPGFSPLRLALLEQGFVYAQCNMRGGGEYGEKWHEAGTKLQKQNVFDDFIAAAEWLIANKYTSAKKLAIQGGSNGGLLVGAVINQRPELFGAAIPQVGVMDMLRFHKFTIGFNWIADYGSADNADEFKALYAYSPIHNVREGTKYPPVLITTADHDDRVVPAHSFKYAATMQEKASRENPVLIRIETKSGHGASNTKKQLEETADVHAFLIHNLGVEYAVKSVPKKAER